VFLAAPTTVIFEGRDPGTDWVERQTWAAGQVAGHVVAQVTRYAEQRCVIRDFTASPRPENREAFINAWIEG
jgi:hypothetical protein